MERKRGGVIVTLYSELINSLYSLTKNTVFNARNARSIKYPLPKLSSDLIVHSSTH
jgi:hypothetical protein